MRSETAFKLTSNEGGCPSNGLRVCTGGGPPLIGPALNTLTIAAETPDWLRALRKGLTLAAARSSTVHYLQHLLGCCLLSRNSLADHEEAPACQGMAAVQMQEDPHSDDDLVTTAHEMRLAVF